MAKPDNKPRVRSVQQWRQGWSDELQPLEPLDLTKASTFTEMLAQMSRTAFAGRNLGQAADVLHEMVTDDKCFVVLTLSGAMTMAKMGLVITEMIDQDMVDAIVSTGALMCHGLIEQTGHTHFRYDRRWSDEELYQAGYSRVYDTLELEHNLIAAEKVILHVLGELPTNRSFASWELNQRLGEYLRANETGRGILQSAAAKGIPVYVPAFTDSELGLDVYLMNLLRSRSNQPTLKFDPLRDVDDYFNRIMETERLGIFTIGGGVPRNWAQQVGPLAEVVYQRTDGQVGGLRRFRYGVRICPEPTHWGGLSGCTYSEGVSWGKFIPENEGGRFAEVYADATLAWPILIRGVLERMGRLS